MPDSIDIHRVEMWDHETEVVNCHNDYPPYTRVTITVHTADRRQTVITLYQEVSCDICGNAFVKGDKWKEEADKFVHKDCWATHRTDMDDWIDRFAARDDRWEITENPDGVDRVPQD